LPAFIATKGHDGRFLPFGVFYLQLALSFFCLPLCLAFGVSLATLPVLRLSLPCIYLLDLLFDGRLGFLHRLYLRWRLRRGGNLWRWLCRLRCLG